MPARSEHAPQSRWKHLQTQQECSFRSERGVPGVERVRALLYPRLPVAPAPRICARVRASQWRRCIVAAAHHCVACVMGSNTSKEAVVPVPAVASSAQDASMAAWSTAVHAAQAEAAEMYVLLARWLSPRSRCARTTPSLACECARGRGRGRERCHP
ncbi:hypothetical protein EON67_07000 [archaeon]|nr:MAG: hypothetical protein EON67_07000 [archaeon]